MLNYKKGINSIELLVVLAVLGVIFAIILPQFSKTREQQMLKNGVENTISAIDKAKTETLSSLNSSEYGVHFQADKVIIFKGKSFVPNTPDNENINITSPASISNVTLGGVNDFSGEIYFNRLSGAPSAFGTVTISTPSYSKLITISATGNTSVD